MSLEIDQPYRCGVRGCPAIQLIVEQDERITKVECPEHDCVTTWDTTPVEQREQQIIRVQDNWRQHATRPGK